MFGPPSRLSKTIRFRPEAGKSASFQFVKNFRPDDIAGITLWLDASDTSTFLFTGPGNTEVFRWFDKAVKTNSFVKGRSNNPIYNATGFNGLPAVMFSSTRSLKNDAAFPYTLTSNDALTIFIVGQLTNNIVQQGIIFRALKVYDEVPKPLDIGSDPDNSFNWFGTFDIAIFADSANNQSVPNNEPTVLAFRIPAGASTENLFLNADPISNNSATQRGGSDSLSVQWDAIFLGTNNPDFPDNLDYYWNGPISEILIYDTNLSDNDLLKVSAYLGQKWGFKSSLFTPYNSESVFRPIPKGPNISFRNGIL